MKQVTPKAIASSVFLFGGLIFAGLSNIVSIGRGYTTGDALIISSIFICTGVILAFDVIERTEMKRREGNL